MFWNRKIDVQNKAVLITGCGSGFGNRLALRLNHKGFRVYATVLDQNKSGSQDLIKNCEIKGKMSVIQMDVTNQEMIDKCFSLVKNELDINGEQLWAVVNNAGRLAYGHTEWGQFDEYQKVFDVNVFGVVRVTRKFLPLIKTSQGRIVITASLAGRITLDNLGAYCMSKYAVISYSDALRREMRKFKVKVSTIEPGIFKTAMFYNIETIFENTWNQTDLNIRQLFGENYYSEHLKNLKIYKKITFGNKNLDIVVNDMIDAIRSKNPNRSYKPVNRFIFKLLPIFLPITPQTVIDIIFRIMDRTVPDSMSQSSSYLKS